MEGEALIPEQPDELPILAERLNESLRLSGSSSAEHAFGLGCSLGFTPLLVILAILFLFRLTNLILAGILLVIGLLALIGVTMLVAQRARHNGIQRAYRTRVEAEINQYIAQNNLSRRQFDAIVSQILPDDAPLQAFLSKQEYV